MKSLIRSGFSTVGVNVLGTGATMVTAMLLTRLMSTEGYGVYVFTMSIVAVMASLCQLGGQNMAVKTVAELASCGQLPVLKGFLRCLFALTAAVALSVAAALFGASELLPDLAFGQFVSVAAALIPVYAMSAIVSGVIRGLDWPALGILHDVVLKPVFFAIALLIGVGLYKKIAPTEAVLLNVAGALGALVVGVMIMRLRLRGFVHEGQGEYFGRKWLRDAMPLFGVSLIGALIENVPAWILIALATPTDVALFKVASQGGVFISFVLLSLNSVAMPKISAAYAAKDFSAIETVSQSTVKIGLLFTLPLLLLFTVLPQEIIGLLFGEPYASAAPALVIYSIGRYLMILLGIPGAVLMMTGHANVVMRGWLLSACVSTALALALTPSFGYVGMAIALIIGEFGLNTFLMWRVKKLHGVTTRLGWGRAAAVTV